MGVQFKTVCSICSALQLETPSGVSCINGHGGAPGTMKTMSNPLTKRERQWIDSCIPKCMCGANLGRDRVAAGITLCTRCDAPEPPPTTDVTVSREDLEELLTYALQSDSLPAELANRISSLLNE